MSTKIRAIPCSERMPTREDANKYGEVLWVRRWLCPVVSEWRRQPSRLDDLYWFPLNRDAFDFGDNG